MHPQQLPGSHAGDGSILSNLPWVCIGRKASLRQTLSDTGFDVNWLVA